MRNLAGNLVVYLHVVGLMVAVYGAVESLAGFFGNIMVLVIVGACVVFCVCGLDRAKLIRVSKQPKIAVLVTLLVAILLCVVLSRLGIVRVDVCDAVSAAAYVAWLLVAAPLLSWICQVILTEVNGPSVTMFCVVTVAFGCVGVFSSGFAAVCRIVFPTTACIVWLAPRCGLRARFGVTILEDGGKTATCEMTAGVKGAPFSLVPRCVFLNLCACLLLCGMVGYVVLGTNAVGLAAVFGILAFLLLTIPGCLYFDACVRRDDDSGRLWIAVYFMLLTGLLPLVAATPDSLIFYMGFAVFMAGLLVFLLVCPSSLSEKAFNSIRVVEIPFVIVLAAPPTLLYLGKSACAVIVGMGGESVLSITASLVIVLLSVTLVRVLLAMRLTPSELKEYPGAVSRLNSQTVAKYGLTAREEQICDFLLQGHTLAAIADRLGIALSTVQGYSKSLYKKLGVHSRQEVVDLVERARSEK